MRLPVGVAGFAGAGAARLLAATWRLRRIGPDGRASAPEPGELEPAVYALWHEHLLPLAIGYRGSRALVLVSRSRDGEVLARLLAGLGYGTIRASSSRGAVAGLRALASAARSGRAVAVAPDGPRGPRRRCKLGILRLAAASTLPIVPVAAAASRGWRLSSWDRFLVPAPGSLVTLGHGSPIRIPDGTTRSQLAVWMVRLQEALDRTAAACETAAGEAASRTRTRATPRGSSTGL